MAIDPDQLEQLPPVGHVKMVYLGPVSPHWEVHGVFGDGRQGRDDVPGRIDHEWRMRTGTTEV